MCDLAMQRYRDSRKMNQVSLYPFEINAPSISVYLLYSSQTRESEVNSKVSYPQHNNNLFKEYWLNK